MSELETHVGTRGEVPEQVGFRNKLRARWRALPIEQRWGATIALQLALALGLWFLDRSLGYAALVVEVLLWLRSSRAFPGSSPSRPFS